MPAGDDQQRCGAAQLPDVEPRAAAYRPSRSRRSERASPQVPAARRAHAPDPARPTAGRAAGVRARSSVERGLTANSQEVGRRQMGAGLKRARWAGRASTAGAAGAHH